ncbi:hypothetical protein MUP01_10860 [Candidatus Bathyarchaeota archaeon]|nr:hypothetical protein [Candidatus Bathyarchaeota archaeon]
MDWFIVHVHRMGAVKFNSKKRFDSFIDFVGDKLQNFWVEVERFKEAET